MATSVSGAGAHAAVATTDRIPASKGGVKGYHEVGSITYLKSEVDAMLRGTAAAWTKASASGVRAGLDLDFSNDRYAANSNPARWNDLLTFSRAAAAYDTLTDGSLSLVAANVPRLGGGLGFLAEPARTNAVRNNMNIGAVAGTPGTLPTNWSTTAGTGLSREVVGTGTELGVPYIDVRFFGTATSTGPIQFIPDSSLTATIGTTVANSVYLAIVGGSLANVSGIVLRANNEVGTTQAFASGAGPSGAIQRFVNIRTLTTTGPAPHVRWNALDTVSPIDFTLRMGLFQCEIDATYATSPIPTSGAAATRPADVMRVIGTPLTAAIGSGAEFTLAAEMVSPASATVGAGLIAFGTANEASPSASDETLIANTSSPANGFQATSNTAGANVFTNTATAGNAPPATTKVAARFKAADFAISHNGAAVITDGAGAMPAASQTRLAIGSDPSAIGTNAFMGRIRRLTAWPTGLVNTDVVGLST